jgi:hypothetical protein
LEREWSHIRKSHYSFRRTKLAFSVPSSLGGVCAATRLRVASAAFSRNGDILNNHKLNGKWEAFRRNNITSLVREVVKRVRAEAPGVKIRADVFKRPNGEALTIAQEWSFWCREGLMDIISPMDGTSTPKELAGLLKDQISAAAGTTFVPTFTKAPVRFMS